MPISSSVTGSWRRRARCRSYGAVYECAPSLSVPMASTRSRSDGAAAMTGARLAPGAGHVRVEPHSAIRLTPPRPRDEIGALRHLVLAPPDVGVLGRQLDRFGTLDDDADRLLRLPQRRLARIDLEREDRRQAGLHLDHRVALEDVDRQAALLRLAEHRRLLLVLVLERHHDVRLVDVAGDDHRELQLADRLLEALAADALRQNPQRGQ